MRETVVSCESLRMATDSFDILVQAMVMMGRHLFVECYPYTLFGIIALSPTLQRAFRVTLFSTVNVPM